MNIGPTTFAASLAATTLNPARGGDTERAQHDAAAKERQVEGDRKAESAAGVGTTEGDEAASDRDADGRRLWEKPPQGKGPDDADDETEVPPAKDLTGQSGSLLDLTG
ncbi:MAG: hypothetical protein B7Z73_03845 [Planctomycetia bacterium 21-64-5]|nr:MAG: hypothetical protein B7Z73_03845 [Planctomycetia bacterium 21-64-5]HQU42422.1 hypothetical protein [Pirellulales bacterium]